MELLFASGRTVEASTWRGNAEPGEEPAHNRGGNRDIIHKPANDSRAGVQQVPAGWVRDARLQAVHGIHGQVPLQIKLVLVVLVGWLFVWRCLWILWQCHFFRNVYENDRKAIVFLLKNKTQNTHKINKFYFQNIILFFPFLLLLLLLSPPPLFLIVHLSLKKIRFIFIFSDSKKSLRDFNKEKRQFLDLFGIFSPGSSILFLRFHFTTSFLVSRHIFLFTQTFL